MSKRARQRRKAAIMPYMPGRPCPACQAEGAAPAHHSRPVLAVFGRTPQWPCSGLDATLGAHVCIRCECGYTWMESLPQEETMGFIKTASGHVTGTDQRGMARTAAQAPGWGPDDEAGLAAEIATDGQPGEGEDGPLPVP